MTDEKKNLSKEERKEQAWYEYGRKTKPIRDGLDRKTKPIDDEYVRKRKPFVDEFERKRKPLWDELERICREIDAEDDDD